MDKSTETQYSRREFGRLTAAATVLPMMPISRNSSEVTIVVAGCTRRSIGTARSRLGEIDPATNLVIFLLDSDTENLHRAEVAMATELASPLSRHVGEVEVHSAVYDGDIRPSSQVTCCIIDERGERKARALASALDSGYDVVTFNPICHDLKGTDFLEPLIAQHQRNGGAWDQGDDYIRQGFPRVASSVGRCVQEVEFIQIRHSLLLGSRSWNRKFKPYDAESIYAEKIERYMAGVIGCVHLTQLVTGHVNKGLSIEGSHFVRRTKSRAFRICTTSNIATWANVSLISAPYDEHLSEVTYRSDEDRCCTMYGVFGDEGLPGDLEPDERRYSGSEILMATRVAYSSFS